MLKEKPPEVSGAGAASAFLLAAPKRKADGAKEAAASFFSSGFPKANVGATGSLSVCKDPNVDPPCGVVADTLPNTDPVVVVAVVVSFDDVVLSLFS